MNILRGLLIKSPWIEKILQGRKTWEIRGSNTNIRGEIALIRSGSGLVVGTCELVDVIGTLTLSEMRRNVGMHCIPLNDLERGLYYEKPYAWVLKNAKPLKRPIPYKHPSGAIIWVKLPDSTRKLILSTKETE